MVISVNTMKNTIVISNESRQAYVTLIPQIPYMHFIEGDGKNFDYGIDYTECANVKFIRAQGAMELAPYTGATDKVVSEKLGWGLKRTMTLADGKAKCDFRFKQGGKPSIQ